MRINFNNNAYAIALSTISALLLICNFAVFSHTIVSKFFIPLYFLLTIGFCYFTYHEFKHDILIRLQIFFIVPLLINFALVTETRFSEYVLYFTTFSFANMLCLYELFSKKLKVQYSKETVLYASASIIVIISTIILCLFFSKLIKLIMLASMLVLYMIVPGTPDKLPISEDAENNKNKKALFYIVGIVLVYVLMLFSTKLNFILYCVYVISVINLCFCFRNDKWYFLLATLLLSIASLVPIGIHEMYVDSFLLTMLVLLFHVKSPIVYFKDTKYGFLTVEYDYKTHRLMLLNDGVYQGEKRLSDKKYVNSMYYGDIEKGAVSNIFNLISKHQRKNESSKVAILGLGSGAMAAFGSKDQEITFYEINPEMVKIAEDKRFFNYLSSSQAKINIILGDARLKLIEATNGYYDLICVDVYIENNIPRQFMTLEALKLYFSKLQKNGILLMHITSKDKNLENIIAGIAQHLKLSSYINYQAPSSSSKVKKKSLGLIVDQKPVTPFKERIIKYIEKLLNISLTNLLESETKSVYSWVAISQSADTLKTLENSKEWHKLRVSAIERDPPLYTDKFIGYGGEEIITKKID